MKQNDEIILTITDISGEGQGVGRHEGCVVFVDNALPHDVVKARIRFTKKNFAEADVLELIVPSHYRVTPKCTFFGVCGGCALQHLGYEHQVHYKFKRVEDAFKHIGGFPDLNILPIITTEEEYFYRNKMEYSFSDELWLNEKEFTPSKESPVTAATPELYLGLHVPGNWKKVLDIDECWLESHTSNRILNAIRTFAREHSLPAYSPEKRSGYFRNLIIREGKNTNQIMVNLITYEDSPEIMQQLSAYLTQEIPEITTIVNGVNTQIAQVARGEFERCYFGSGRITDTIGKFTFTISARSFFQTNTRQAERLYSVAKEFASLDKSDVVFDLYCGTGTIAIYLSDACAQVFGIDVVESAIMDARENAELNKIDNVFFITRDLQTKNVTWKDELPLPNVVIVDPPRNGLHSKLVEEIVTLAPKKIVYVSCNPATQARDAKMFAYAGYAIKKIQPVDMFPHTTHVESVALLER